MARLAKGCPLLASADIAASVAWYRDKLGFGVVRLEDDGSYGIVRRDEVELHFWPCKDRNIAENTSAYIRVDDVDAVQGGMSGAADGGRISPVTDRDWGMREFYVWDPDGNLLRFGQSSTEHRAA